MTIGVTDQEDITCPFCQDHGFDLVGLKIHLMVWCEEFQKTNTDSRGVFGSFLAKKLFFVKEHQSEKENF